MTTACILAAFLLGLFVGGRSARHYFMDGLVDMATRCPGCHSAVSHFAESHDR